MLNWDDNKVLQIAQNVQKAIADCAYDLQNKSVMQAPIDTGAMRHSCKVVQTKNFEYEVKYDKTASCYGEYYYALRQHEDLSLNHLPYTNAKFLEKPLIERSGVYKHWIGMAINNGCNGTVYTKIEEG